jgi:cysteine desulfuration protein SufE
MPTIAELQQQIVEDLAFLDDWRERYREIIALGSTLPPFPETLKIERNLVRGCQNRVWVSSRFDNGLVFYQAESEAQIVRGLAAILVKCYSGFPPDDILNAPATFIHDLKLGENLTRSRVNGLSSILTRIKQYAMSYKLVLAQRPPLEEINFIIKPYDDLVVKS